MMKNSTAQSWETGMWMMASVNTMNASPGPSDTWRVCVCVCVGGGGGGGGGVGGEPYQVSVGFLHMYV